MFPRSRSKLNRSIQPALVSLEERALLNAALPHYLHQTPVPAAEVAAKHGHGPKFEVNGPSITMIDRVNSGGYTFTDFDGPLAGTDAGAGTNMNGISNTGVSVGFTIANNGDFNNFLVNPLKSTSVKLLNINGSSAAMALGTNSYGTVVGTDGNGNAFYENHGKVKLFIPLGGMSAVALGINDRSQIVGQYVTLTATPGFVRLSPKTYITINAPSGANVVNAQGINNKGLVVGFYVGTDGQDHGFMVNTEHVKGASLTGTPIADPKIPTVAGEPGATFVFSQILGINDKGIAVGYYGDSTTSQHGFIYNTHTGVYTFLDDPDEAFDNGVEVTQITGITNSGEITGFYSDANGVFHGFVATPSTM